MLAAGLMAIASAAAPMQDSDRAYSNEKLGIELTVPEKWKIEKSDEMLCEFSRGEEAAGWLAHREDAKLSLADFAAEQEKELGGCKCLQEQKLKKSPGEWLRRDYSVETEDGTLRIVALFVKKESMLLSLMIAVETSQWEKFKEEVEKVAEGLKLSGDRKFQGWQDYKAGSWVIYEQVQSGSSDEIRGYYKYQIKEVTRDGVKLNGGTGDRAEDDPKLWFDANLGPGENLWARLSKEIKRGEEELEVGSKKERIKTVWVEYETEHMAMRGTVKLWYLADVPGGVVQVRREVKEDAIVDILTVRAIRWEKK